MAQTDLEQPQTTADGRTDARWMVRLWSKIRSAIQSIVAPAAGITVTTSGSTATLALANDLAAVEGLAGTGLATRTASDTWTTRTITGTANEITATNGNGVSGNPTLSLPSALTFTGKTVTGGAFENTTIGGTTPGAGTFTTLASTGDTTIGDSAADSLTTNFGTVTINNNISATRTSGTVAAGTVNSVLLTNTFAGDSGGTTSIGGFVTSITGSGANAINAMTGNQTTAVWGGSVTAATVTGNLAIVRSSSSGAVTALRGHTADMRINGSGNATVITGFQTITPSFSSTGVATFMRGFATSDIGHATLVTNALSFDAASNTTSATLTANYRAQQNSGTGCWAFYSVGTANSAHAGNVRIGSVTAPTVALDVTGAILASTTITSAGPTSGVGYSTGAGGTVTQITSRTTGVTLNKVSGAITLVSAAGSTTPATFTVTNSACAATDTPIVVQKSGTDLYEIHVTAVAAGSFNITYWTTGGTTTEQPVFNFNIIKGVTS